MIHGTTPVLIMVVVGTTTTVSVGTVAGFRGGMSDRVLMTLCDMILAIPGLRPDQQSTDRARHAQSGEEEDLP